MRIASILALLLAFGLGGCAQPPTAATPSQALSALFDRQWEATSRRFPEWTTMRGDLRFNDRLFDASAEAEAAADADDHRWLAEARAFPREGLAAAERVSLDIFTGELQRRVDAQRYPGPRGMRVEALGGVQRWFAELMQAVPVQTEAQARDVLARMAAWPRQMDQNIEAMRRSQRLRWVPARSVLERAVAQIDSQMAQPFEQSPYAAPFRRLGSAIPAPRQTELQAAGRAALAEHVLPTLRRLRAYLVDEALPAAPASGALLNYPDGVAVYEQAVRESTTTALTAAEIHAIGLRELARIRAEMDGVMRTVKFDGGFDAFVKHLNTDPRFIAASPEALLDGYRAIGKRIDAELPRLFAELPRAPWGVRAMPAFRGPDAAEDYSEPDAAVTRPGWFNANAQGWRKRPTWSMATLVAHEAVPGHHLQGARALEMGDLPAFRRNLNFTAYGEGWALYAETLGREIGLYDDPYALFGHLQMQALRAARLVVDTGIHAQGWSRERAIAFMRDATGMDDGFITSEVDRYTSWPGQALGYMIGQLKIRELRTRAETALGPKFDLRRFHNVLIDQGALPLDTLERVVDDWIAARR